MELEKIPVEIHTSLVPVKLPNLGLGGSPKRKISPPQIGIHERNWGLALMYLNKLSLDP